MMGCRQKQITIFVFSRCIDLVVSAVLFLRLLLEHEDNAEEDMEGDGEEAHEGDVRNW